MQSVLSIPSHCGSTVAELREYPSPQSCTYSAVDISDIYAAADFYHPQGKFASKPRWGAFESDYYGTHDCPAFPYRCPPVQTEQESSSTGVSESRVETSCTQRSNNFPSCIMSRIRLRAIPPTRLGVQACSRNASGIVYSALYRSAISKRNERRL